MTFSDDELIAKYLETLDVEGSNTKELFLLGLIGIIGSGKSYLAQRLSEETNLFVASNDQIRRFLDGLNLDWSTPMQPVVQKIAESRTHYLFKNRVSHIQDADMIQFANLAQENAAKFGAHVFFINVTCPENIILDRLKKRESDLVLDPNSSISKSGVDQYFKRKIARENFLLPEVLATIDTAHELQPQVDELVKQLRDRDVL